MLNLLKKFVRDEEGQDFVEYAMLLGGIALVLGVTIGTLGTQIQGLYGRIGAAVAAL